MGVAQDSREAYLDIPWANALLSDPKTTWRIPGSRRPKISKEDSLFAETFKTSQTVRNLLCIYQEPSSLDDKVPECSLIATIGDGLDGHPQILHGGIVATLIDESMGMLQSVNYERSLASKTVKDRGSKTELPADGAGTFTAQLNVKYIKPVRTPGSVEVVARGLRREGRKEWIYSEIRQWSNDGRGEYVVCASAEALFIGPKTGGNKL